MFLNLSSKSYRPHRPKLSFHKGEFPLMRRTILLLTALILAATSLALGQTNPSHTAHLQSDKAGASMQCRGDQLSVREVPNSEDAAMGGARAVDFAFKNTSNTPCTLKGYPRVQLLDRSGRPARHGLAVNNADLAGEQPGQTPQLVTLAPGKTAWFLFHYNNGGAGHIGKPCPTYPKMQITAPGTKRAFILRDSIQSCREVEVSAVQSGMPQTQ
ncbi:MAG: hypothetical protein QOJ02_858 [Acidobacteriota bacterium]|nr:hypothetical protein [Acidobacteriota bacterium]